MTRSTESQRASLESLFDTSWGDHSVKIGGVLGESTLFENATFTGDPPASYISLNGIGRPIHLNEVTGVVGDPWSTSDFGVSTDETQGLREHPDGRPDRDPDRPVGHQRQRQPRRRRDRRQT
ncbi:MAG: hypothetical protein HC822_28040 [Oscillochloris sp.]|nr:hypothetical protein [Oscillochloris sp.]